jgi:hypothetical protein
MMHSYLTIAVICILKNLKVVFESLSSFTTHAMTTLTWHTLASPIVGFLGTDSETVFIGECAQKICCVGGREDTG